VERVASDEHQIRQFSRTDRAELGRLALGLHDHFGTAQRGGPDDLDGESVGLALELGDYRLLASDGPAGGQLPDLSPEEWGKIQWEQKGCQTCHNIDGTKSKGPSWKGIWGESVKVKASDGKEITVVVDENYVRESMMVPGAKVVDGFDNIMPTFQGLLRENEIRGLVAFIKSLK
jgi:cytochrome c2